MSATGNKQTEDTILAYLRMNSPATIKMIEQHTKFSHQTIRNYIEKLMNLGQVRYHHSRISKGKAYEITTGGKAGITIRINGEPKKLREVLERMAEIGRIPKDSTGKNLYGPIIQLFALAANALDDDNPIPVSNSEIKQLQYDMAQYRQEVINLLTTIDDMLNLDALWDATELPKILIMQDQMLTPEMVVSQLDRIQ